MLEFAILFLKVLNIVYPLILISLNVVERSYNDFSNRWCKRENVEPDALKEWKLNIFKNIDTPISFYSSNKHLLHPKTNFHLKRGIQDFHMNFVSVPADKASNNVVDV